MPLNLPLLHSDLPGTGEEDKYGVALIKIVALVFCSSAALRNHFRTLLEATSDTNPMSVPLTLTSGSSESEGESHGQADYVKK
jgi:hypothetical protein